MSSTKPGRHRAAKHAAPKKSRRSSKNLGSALGFVGLGATVITSAGSAPTISAESVAPTTQTPQATNSSGKKHTITVVKRQAVLSRAWAASRSEQRTSVQDANATNDAQAAGDPTTTLDTTPTLTSSERFALRAVAPTTDQLDELVAETEQQQAARAQYTLNLIEARRAAAAKAAIAAREAAREKAAAGSGDSAVGIDGFSWTTNVTSLSGSDLATVRATIGQRRVPVRTGYRLSARFGQHGGMWSTGWHTGIDFDVPTGTPVVAVAPGVIVRSGWAGSYGYRIEIDHGNGYVTTYNHLSRIVKSSGSVEAGEDIGRSGSTGNSSGAHLHFEVLRGNSFVDPAKWLWG